jgi:2-polyprenyl-3-methyl-5-hydroxy-6-metoxy-1,4-benzoquinol methylase
MPNTIQLMTKTQPQSEYKYASSQLDHTYDYLTTPLLTMLPPLSGQKIKILDLGCGNGSFSNVLTKLGYAVLGIEQSSAGIAIAQQNYPDCDFRQGSIYELSDPELQHSFDAVISVEVIEHLSDPRALVTAAKYCLKPEGKFILTTPYHGYLKNLALALSGQMDAHFTALWDGGHIKFFSVPTLTQLLTTESCTDIQFKYAGRIPYLWSSMLCTCKVN